MQCFLVGGGEDGPEVGLAGFVRSLGLQPATAPDLARLRDDKRLAGGARSLVLIPDTPSHPLDMAEAIEFAKEQGGQAFVVWLADTVAPDDYKRLVRTGSADWITWRDHRDELRDLVARLGADASPGRAATVLSFVPSKGGVGNTTVVIEVAVHLSTRRKRGGARVAIVDLNLQGGTVADALDIEPRFDVAEIMHRPERLDEHLVDVFTSRQSKTLDVFASPVSRLGLEAVNPAIIFTFIDAIASRYDAILFDLPAHWSSWTDNLLQGSDAVVVCGGESVPALRRLVATLAHVDGLGVADGKLAAVVNAVETDLLGRVARRAVIERALARRRTFLVRRDREGTANALDVGRPLSDVGPNTRVVRDLKRVADWVETVAERSPVLQSRAVPVRGAAA